MNECLGVCAVFTGYERSAQHEIERVGYGVRNPSYRVAFHRHGRRHVRLRPLFPGYLFPALRAGWGELNEIEGVMVLTNAGKPLCIVGSDAERLAELERRCLLGEFNKVHAPQRAPNGQFKQRKRRRRPRAGKLLRHCTNSGAGQTGGNYRP